MTAVEVAGTESLAAKGETRGPALLVIVVGIAAALFLAWPSFSIDRGSDWRPILAGFQLQKETGDFIGARASLIHFHGLDGRPGRLRFTLSPRIDGDRVEISITTPGGARSLRLEGTPADVEIPFGEVADLELGLEAVTATNPRPIVVSGLRIERDFGPMTLALSLLPLVLGALASAFLAREAGPRAASLFALLIVVAAVWFAVSAFDPVRASSFTSVVRDFAPMTLALAFAGAGLSVPGSLSTAIALAGVTLSLHLSSVHFGFVYDDRLWARPWTLSELASTFAGSEDPRGISGQQYRPIPSITHALDHASWGSSSFAFHLTNMALHVLSAFLLHLLLRRMRVPRPAALLGALTLAAHPMAASSIGWISERTDTLTDIFMLSTLLVFLGPRGTQALRVLGVALLALWSKETAVMLPVLVVMFSLVGLNSEERRARFAAMRSLFAFVVLFVAVWVSLFPEKTVGRLLATAGTPAPENSSSALFGNLFSQLFHPIGFETWRATLATASVGPWLALAVLLGVLAFAASFKDHTRALPWRLVVLGLAVSALVVIPFRGHDAVDIYRLGHTPIVGFGIVVAGFGMLLIGASSWRALPLALLLLLRFAPMSSETVAAWGYPGFQFRMALRFNLENPTFMNGLTPEMRRDLERESRFEAHRDNPLSAPFDP